MTWTIAALLALTGCKERPLDMPNSPPEPPGAELWPLGGKIYHGVELPTEPTVSTASGETTADPVGTDAAAPADGEDAAAPTEDAAVETEAAPAGEDVAAPAEDAAPEADPTPSPAEAPEGTPEDTP